MSVAPVRPLTAAEAALRVALAPEPAQALRVAEAPPVAPPQGSNFVQVELRRPAAPASQSPSPAAGEPTPALAVRAAMQTSVARQAALGPLLADLTEVVRTASLPLPLRNAAVQLLAAQPILPMQPTGADLRRSVARSGLFLEARLAQTLPPRPGEPPLSGPLLTVPEALRGDAKAHLLAFRAALEGWAGAQQGPPPASLYGEARRPPAPPYAEGPTEGQPPAASTLPSDASPAVVVQRLMQAADGVLARQELLQMASLRDASPAAAEARNWMFELPIETPQGPAVAHFEIARDGGRGSPGIEVQPSWRARFSLDVEPLGPVHVHVSLRLGRTSVNLWAERSEIAELLRQEQGALASSLRHSSTTVEVAVRDGAPPARIAGAGQFVDEAS